MNRRFYLKWWKVAALMAVGGLCACKDNQEKREHSGAALPTATVRVQKVELAEMASTEEVVGTVRAKIHATLEAKQSGRIEKLPVSLGDTVQAGELVARLDAAETAARVEQAQASLEQAERDWKRVSTLFEVESATRAERDAAEARLRVAKGAVAEAQAALGYAEVVAPFKGVVTRKWADVGDLAAPGKPIIDIDDLSVLQVELDVPEGLSIRLQPGTEFEIIAPAGRRKAGLREIAPGFDPITRTRRIKLDVADASGIFPGQFVRVAIPVAEGKALVVPEAAIVQRGQLEMVFSSEDQRARMRLVKTGRKTGSGVEILSGLSAGTMVVMEGAERLSDGQPLEVK